MLFLLIYLYTLRFENGPIHGDARENMDASGSPEEEVSGYLHTVNRKYIEPLHKKTMLNIF